jgi:hypothetical protein
MTASDVTPGSVWTSDKNKFIVIQLVETDGHTWVHYRQDIRSSEECKEFSCYVESFVQRFRKTVA